MKGPSCGVASGDTATQFGGVPVRDFAGPDELAVKLICLDGGFAPQLRQVGCALSKRGSVPEVIPPFVELTPVCLKPSAGVPMTRTGEWMSGRLLVSAIHRVKSLIRRGEEAEAKGRKHGRY